MATDGARPNVLFITADDLSCFTPGCFGGRNDVTPQLDALARTGARFSRAHVPIAVCQPSRSAMLTGRWPHRNGAEGFQPIRDDVAVLTDLLRPRGYRCGILGKVNHLQPIERFGWDYVRTQPELGMGRDPLAYGRAATEFMNAASPWFLMANAHDPHRPFHNSAAEAAHFSVDQKRTFPPPSRSFGAADAEPPDFLPDLPAVREEIAEYLGSSRRCDDVVGTVLAALQESGQADNTLVVFLSDNGMAFPFAKANCYLQSTATPMIVRWPGHVVAGSVDDQHFVSGLDLFPSFCEAAGIDVPDYCDGRSLLSLFGGATQVGRDRLFTVFHETSAGRRYDMRCVQDRRFGYIWNAWSDGENRYRAENMQGLTWTAMLEAAVTDPILAARTKFYLHRTPEEFYRLDADPAGLENLVERDELRAQLAAARVRMGEWMSQVGDPLADAFAVQCAVATSGQGPR
jgi:N-sulfoglucosamine sulfohydrolase